MRRERERARASRLMKGKDERMMRWSGDTMMLPITIIAASTRVHCDTSESDFIDAQLSERV